MRSANCSRIVIAVALGQLALAAQDVNEEFEVASVRATEPTKPGEWQILQGRVSGGPGTSDPERIAYERVPLIGLIMAAYGVQMDQVIGPDWATTEDLHGAARFDISVKVPPNATKKQVATMLQNLLAQRFQLKLHHTVVQSSGYALILGKGGAKLRLSGGPLTESERGSPTHGFIQLETQKDGFPQLFPGRNMGGIFKDGVVRMRFRDYPMFELAQQLSAGLGVRLIDKTGLGQTYDFTLEFTPPPDGTRLAVRLTLPLSIGQEARETKDPPSLAQQDAVPIVSSALEKQLGLKLDATKIRVDTLVIDHLERTPSEN